MKQVANAVAIDHDSHLHWRRNLHVLWFGCFMAGIGFSCISPFIALFIDSIGHYHAAATAFWSGLAFSSTFLVKAVVSPLWGQLADRYGRKPMLLRASLGMAVVIGCMGFVNNVYELVALRMLQGGFSGYISNANALIAAEAPHDRSGEALGTLATGDVSGTLLGPLIGGFISDTVGYRYTFFVTGLTLLCSFILTAFCVHEHYVPVAKKATRQRGDLFRRLPHRRLVFGMFATTMFIQATNNSITPILSLYVRQLMHGAGHVALAAGVIQGINGLATIIAAPHFGRIGDRIGSQWILLAGLLFSVFVFFPMAFVQNVWELGLLRLLVGVSDAALIPSVQTLLAKYTAGDTIGRIFSWNQSFQATGNVAGPMMGSTVSRFAGYRSVFIVTSLLVVVNLLLVFRNTAELRHRQKRAG